MSPLEWLALFFFISFTYWDGVSAHLILWTKESTFTYRQSFLRKVRQLTKNWLLFDAWIFGAVWSVLYPLIATAIFLYWKNSTDIVPIFDSVMIVYAINIVLTHLYMPLLFLFERYCHFSIKLTFFFVRNGKKWLFYGPSYAAVDAILVFGTSLYVLIRFGLSGYWVSFGLYVAYTVWAFYIMSIGIWLAYKMRLKGFAAAVAGEERTTTLTSIEKSRV